MPCCSQLHSALEKSGFETAKSLFFLKKVQKVRFEVERIAFGLAARLNRRLLLVLLERCRPCFLTCGARSWKLKEKSAGPYQEANN